MKYQTLKVPKFKFE